MKIDSIRIQDRDLGVFGEFGEVGVMDTPMIQRHFPTDRTGEACLRRLRLYGRHELTRAIRLKVAYADRAGGRLATLHCLTRRGADFLFEQTGIRPRRVLRSDPRPETLLHRLGMVRVLLTLKDACALQKLPRPEWFLEYDTRPAVRPGAPLTERFVLYEEFPTADGKSVSCRPDASTWLQIPAAGTAFHHLLLYWEYDRSTEVLKQVTAKVEPYRLLLETESYRRHWPDVPAPTVRVFFVAQSNERLENVMGAMRDRPGAESFRFTTVQDMTPDRLLTEPIWQTIAGERRAILKAPVTPR